MVEMNTLGEKPLTLVELSEKIEQIKKRDKELGSRAERINEYLNKFVKLKTKKVEELKKEMDNLDIPRLRERHLVKIIDILPEDMDSLKMIFAGENVTIKQDDLQRILNVIKNV